MRFQSRMSPVEEVEDIEVPLAARREPLGHHHHAGARAEAAPVVERQGIALARGVQEYLLHALFAQAVFECAHQLRAHTLTLKFRSNAHLAQVEVAPRVPLLDASQREADNLFLISGE